MFFNTYMVVFKIPELIENTNYVIIEDSELDIILYLWSK